MDSSSLNKLKVAELQQLLRDRGLSATGNKADLVQVKCMCSSQNSLSGLVDELSQLDFTPF